MQTLQGNLYVVTSAGMSQAVLRSKTLSFEPQAAKLAGPLLGVSEETVRVLGLDEKGHWIGSPGLTERRADISQKLSPGLELSKLSTATAVEIARIFEREALDSCVCDLYLWLRETITYATAVGLYGPQCPIASDHSLVDDLWFVYRPMEM